MALPGAPDCVCIILHFWSASPQHPCCYEHSQTVAIKYRSAPRRWLFSFCSDHIIVESAGSSHFKCLPRVAASYCCCTWARSHLQLIHKTICGFKSLCLHSGGGQPIFSCRSPYGLLPDSYSIPAATAEAKMKAAITLILVAAVAANAQIQVCQDIRVRSPSLTSSSSKPSIPSRTISSCTFCSRSLMLGISRYVVLTS